VALNAGEWMIQNVANSSVGRLVIALARLRGIKTMNVVRRASLFGELQALGADACVVDGPELAATVKTQTGGAPIRLGLDAVAGAATGRVASCLAEGGVVCAYGAMSGEDAIMPRSALSTGAVTLTGFTLTRPLSTYPRDKVRAIYADLARQVVNGTLHAPVEKVYAIDDIKDALVHAQRGERTGKILVAPNGPV
jgi:NADPH:quinone reductase-like Zn-dependent oxidoreductase